MPPLITAKYEAHKQEVFRYLLRLCGDPSLAEDLTSDTFLAAILALPRFRGESGVRTWLFSIARHKWSEHLRREKRRLSPEEAAALLPEDGGPEAALLSKDRLEAVLRLLQNEEPRARETVRLRMEGWSYREIGEKLGISESAARVLDFRAKKRMREALRKEGLLDDESNSL